MADTNLTQLVINVGTTAQIEAGIAGGTITSDMLSISTDGADYLTTADVTSSYSSTGTEPVNGTAVASALSTLSIPTTIGSLSDVTITSATDGQALIYDSANQIWKNGTVSGGGSYSAGTGIDITSNTISVTSPTITNTATGTNSLTILGTASTAVQGVNIGVDSSTLRNGVAIGYNSQNTGSYNVSIGYNSSCSVNLGYSVALGGYAKTTASYAIQIGYGTNSEANSVYMSTSSSNNWKMLGNDGLIPSGRIPISTSVSSSSDNTTVVGAKLFYDTCGDIEATLNAIRGV